MVLIISTCPAINTKIWTIKYSNATMWSHYDGRPMKSNYFRLLGLIQSAVLHPQYRVQTGVQLLCIYYSILAVFSTGMHSSTPLFFFFAILEILANFCTQRTKNHSNLEYFIKKFQRKIPIFSKRKRKILSEKKLESQASQKNYSFSHLCSNFYIQLPFQLYKYTHSKLKYA
jgi:hypothetical protein